MATKSASDSPWLMSPEEVTRQLHTLSDELLLTPPQTGAVLQAATDQLANWRVTGEGPPFVKMGSGPKAQVRYPLGGVRKWRAERTFSNTSMANVSRFASLGGFLSSGSIQDFYLAAFDEAGGLWEFWESVRNELDIVEVRWMPMGDMLEGFRKQALQRHADAEAGGIGDGLRVPSIAGRETGI